MKNIIEIISNNYKQKLGNLLVVGCGSGLEAAILSKKLHASVTGIDIKERFDKEAIKYAHLEVGDAMALCFKDSSFDFVYSYHALEHISNPVVALKEIKRVLKDNGGYWIGTPNRNRLMAYIGSKGTTLCNKIQWNIDDWNARLTGNFKNDLGAHAGFLSNELMSLLSNVFSSYNEMTDVYYEKIYNQRKSLIKIVQHLKISKFVYSSVYFLGSK